MQQRLDTQPKKQLPAAVNGASRDNGVDRDSGASRSNGVRSGAWTPDALNHAAGVIPLARTDRSAASAPASGAAAPPLEIAEVRAQLAGKKGKEYWRSLEELTAKPEFQELVEREFPRQAPRDWQPLSRRDFLKYMGAGLALAGVTGCAYQPQEKIVPYVRMPEDIIPGQALYFATAFTLDGYALGLLAESHMGRPTKLEGNPSHPASLGATDIWAQGSLLTLYDPDRSQKVIKLGEDSTWDSFINAVRTRVQAGRANAGQGIRILTTTVTSPTLKSQIDELLRLYPQARWHQYEPAGGHAVREGARLAFGSYAQTVYNFDRADVVLALDSDFFSDEPGRVRYARDFTRKRRIQPDAAKQTELAMNRLYAIESTPTLVSAMADHHLPVQPGDIEAVARFLAIRLAGGAEGAAPGGVAAQWMDALIEDLEGARGRSIVIAGPHQSPTVHALVHRINQQLGNVGTTVTYHEPVEAAPVNQFEDLRALTSDMNAGRVNTLLILGGNPAYDAPADIPFADALLKMSKISAGGSAQNLRNLTMHLGLYYDETARLCQWHVNGTHFLEEWSDARAYDGTTSIIQPLIVPLYGGHSAHELLAVLTGRFDPAGYDIVRDYWRGRWALEGVPFETQWRKVLNDGVVPNTQAAPRAVALRGTVPPATPAPAADALQVLFRPDASVYDGRFSNNAWLQELPKPFTRLTWDNAALIGVSTAGRLDLKTGDMVELSLNNRKVPAPVFVVPGQPENVVTVHLGYGRIRGGQLAEGSGFNAYALRTSQAPYHATGLQIAKTGERYPLATTESHHLINTTKSKGAGIAKPAGAVDAASEQLDVDDTFGRNIIRVGTLEQFRENPNFVKAMDEPLPFLRPSDQTYESVEKAEAALKGHGAEGHAAEGHAVEGHGAEGHAAEGHAEGGAAGHAEHKEHPNSEPSEEVQAEKHYLGIHMHPSMFPYDANIGLLPEDYQPYYWGMTIDLNACIGCSACTIACQSENNISTVGKDQVMIGREMHWIRIDTYFKGEIDNPDTYFQPVPCMHCEKAPCEPVCPVQATSHSSEGVNEMTYNRCVGTRYCSNNCPYKVRRFNFLQFSPQNTPNLMLMMNPDVTVRSRGVMEKCTYCIQRVNLARIEAQREYDANSTDPQQRAPRRLRDGEVVTACQQVCPTEAIAFGDLKDDDSRVAKLKQSPLNYGLLTELNTLPRTTYLGRLRNPNPKIEALETA